MLPFKGLKMRAVMCVVRHNVPPKQDGQATVMLTCAACHTPTHRVCGVSRASIRLFKRQKDVYKCISHVKEERLNCRIAKIYVLSAVITQK